MKLVETLNKVLPVHGPAPTVTEGYSSVVVRYKTSNLPNRADAAILSEILIGTDRGTLLVRMSESTISLNLRTGSVDDFINDVSSLVELQDDEELEVILEIYKEKGQGEINVYVFEAFCEWVAQTSIDDLLTTLKDGLQSGRPVYFNLADQEGSTFYSAKLFFSSSDATRPSELPQVFETQRHLLCDFNRALEYPFTPNFFRLIERPSQANSISDQLDSVHRLFLIAGLFDQTTLDKDRFSYKLNGFRIFEGVAEPPFFSPESTATYSLIYDWVYAEPNKITDKIGLARNILTTYLKNDSLEIEQSAYPSLLSGYNVYLQKNLDKYIDIRGKLNEELNAIAEKATKLGDDYFANYQKSLATVLSFFVSVIVLRVLSTGNFENVFTREATILTLLFISLSAVFFAVALRILNSSIVRLGNKYQDIKDRYKDLLVEADISKILRDDAEFGKEKAEIQRRRRWYSFLWLVTLVSITFTVLTLSASHNWGWIYQKIMSFFSQAPVG
jgi:hypothetical protein